MVMGPTHAMSGAAVWLGTAGLFAASAGHALTPTQTFVGAGVCAGSALLPDIDAPTSTVARSMGPITIGLAHLVSGLSLGFYHLTATNRDKPSNDGHRKLTHTLLAAITSGAGVTALTTAFGRWAVLGVLFFMLSLALRGLMHDWAAREGWIGVTAVAAALTWMATDHVAGQTFWWLGLTVTVGMILHDLGDMITREGAPLAAPLRVNGKSWWDFALPGFLRIRAGGIFEYAILLPVLTAATIVGGMWVIDPGFINGAVAALP